jgi:hypothetical protein
LPDKRVEKRFQFFLGGMIGKHPFAQLGAIEVSIR